MKIERKFAGILVSLDYTFKNVEPWIDTTDAIVQATYYIIKDIEDKAEIKRINLVNITKGNPSKGIKTELYFEVIIKRPTKENLNYFYSKKDEDIPHLDLNDIYDKC